MIKTAYIWENIVVATRELESLLNDGYELVSSKLYEAEINEDASEMMFAAILVKEVK